MLKPSDKPATYEDLCALPEHVVGELIDGTLYSQPRPAGPHAFAAAGILGPAHEVRFLLADFLEPAWSRELGPFHLVVTMQAVRRRAAHGPPRGGLFGGRDPAQRARARAPARRGTCSA